MPSGTLVLYYICIQYVTKMLYVSYMFSYSMCGPCGMQSVQNEGRGQDVRKNACGFARVGLRVGRGVASVGTRMRVWM
jgi:hypothetical protein